MRSMGAQIRWDKRAVSAAHVAKLRAIVVRVGVGRAHRALGVCSETMQAVLEGGLVLEKTATRIEAAIDRVAAEAAA